MVKVQKDFTEIIQIDKQAIIMMSNCAQRKVNEMLRSGGCPAGNTRCSYLRKGTCVAQKPELEYQEGKLCCGSADMW
jgi:hypothetical protein